MHKVLGNYFVSDDKNLLSTEIIHKYLSEESYWAKGRSFEIVKKSIEHSMCIGVYKSNNEQVGFVRVITDYATTYYICDLFILESDRSKGLGKDLTQFIISHPELEGLSGLLLTRDAFGLYSKFGFTDDEEIQKRFMLKKRSK